MTPFVISTSEYRDFQKYLYKYKQDYGQILHYIQFKEEDYYQDTKYLYHCAYFFIYGYRDEDKPITKQELDACHWYIPKD